MPTKIEWAGESWNPLQDRRKGPGGRGYHCTKVSPGCRHCYAERINRRLGNGQPFVETATEFELLQETLNRPKRWRKPRRVFVQSMGDLFHEMVDDWQINAVFQAMTNPLTGAPWHTYIVLTKRIERVLFETWSPGWENIWLGVTAENQEWFDRRWGHLRRIPAARIVISHEPALGPIHYPEDFLALGSRAVVITGGESGQARAVRPMNPDWARMDRDQCREAGVNFFFKQWGEYVGGRALETVAMNGENGPGWCVFENGSTSSAWDRHWGMGTVSRRVGKAKAGRRLDGREWNQLPS